MWNKCKTITRNAKANYYNDCLSTDFKNPKQFWKRINSITNKPIKSLISHIKSKQWNYQWTFTNCRGLQPALLHSWQFFFLSSALQNRCNRSFCFNTITPVDVQQIIDGINSGCSAGPDGLEIKFFKLASHVLSLPLADIFNLSLATCETPRSWNCIRVIPLYKGGDITDMNNYRPISIINSVTKMFEKLIFNQLSKYLNDQTLLSPHQSGFRSNFSTTTALLKFTNDILSASDSNMPTGAIFIDLTKAFDMVDHYRLLDKLYAIGLSFDSLLFFYYFLHHRSQYVTFQGSQSGFKIIDKGVPQGSSLGPLLFSICINDSPQIGPDCLIHLYADDTVIYSSRSDISQIQYSLQTDFNFSSKMFFL